jgi:REP element-mobilizing transposase RayT
MPALLLVCLADCLLEDGMHKHLCRLQRVWIEWPIYFITTCAFNRRSILASERVTKILTEEWRGAHDRHGWAIGRYVVMPDHVHFFCSAELDARPLPLLMQVWKQWTSKRVVCELIFPYRFGRKNFLITFYVHEKTTTRSGITCAKIRFARGWLRRSRTGLGRAR